MEGSGYSAVAMILMVVVLFRFLHADNEMKRIFGSRVVRAEGGG